VIVVVVAVAVVVAVEEKIMQWQRQQPLSPQRTQLGSDYMQWIWRHLQQRKAELVDRARAPLVAIFRTLSLPQDKCPIRRGKGRAPL
jgi:hypothetical protein